MNGLFTQLVFISRWFTRFHSNGRHMGTFSPGNSLSPAQSNASHADVGLDCLHAHALCRLSRILHCTHSLEDVIYALLVKPYDTAQTGLRAMIMQYALHMSLAALPAHASLHCK